MFPSNLWIYLSTDYSPVVPDELLATPTASEACDLFLETVVLKRVAVGNKDNEDCGSPRLRRQGSKKFNAFDLISTALDLSTLFEHRGDVVHRQVI